MAHLLLLGRSIGLLSLVGFLGCADLKAGRANGALTGDAEATDAHVGEVGVAPDGPITLEVAPPPSGPRFCVADGPHDLCDDFDVGTTVGADPAIWKPDVRGPVALVRDALAFSPPFSLRCDAARTESAASAMINRVQYLSAKTGQLDWDFRLRVESWSFDTTASGSAQLVGVGAGLIPTGSRLGIFLGPEGLFARHDPPETAPESAAYAKLAITSGAWARVHVTMRLSEKWTGFVRLSVDGVVVIERKDVVTLSTAPSPDTSVLWGFGVHGFGKTPAITARFDNVTFDQSP